jgi:hypothetical protein
MHIPTTNNCSKKRAHVKATERRKETEKGKPPVRA